MENNDQNQLDNNSLTDTGMVTGIPAGDQRAVPNQPNIGQQVVPHVEMTQGQDTMPQQVVIKPGQQVLQTVQQPQVITETPVLQQAPVVTNQPLENTEQQTVSSGLPVAVANSSQESFNTQPTNVTGLGIEERQQPLIQTTNKKPPLVTLVAKLTFRGDNNRGPQTLFTKIFGIVLVVIALAGSGANIYAAKHVQDSRQALKEYSNPNAAQKEKDKKKAIEDSAIEIQDLKDGKLDVSKLFDSELAKRPQDIKGEKNKQINLSNGVSFAVLDVKRGWDSGDQYNKPASGKEFVLVKITGGNRSKSGSRSITGYDFKLLNSKGGLQDSKYLRTGAISDNGFEDSGSLSPGDIRTGYVLYELDINEKAVLIFEDKGFDYENGNNGKEFLIKASMEIN